MMEKTVGTIAALGVKTVSQAVSWEGIVGQTEVHSLAIVHLEEVVPCEISRTISH